MPTQERIAQELGYTSAELERVTESLQDAAEWVMVEPGLQERLDAVQKAFGGLADRGYILSSETREVYLTLVFQANGLTGEGNAYPIAGLKAFVPSAIEQFGVRLGELQGSAGLVSLVRPDWRQPPTEVYLTSQPWLGE